MVNYPATNTIPGYSHYEVSTQPPWLQDDYGLAWAEAHGILKDVLIDCTRKSILMRLPDYAPPDALSQIGSDRGLEPMPAESTTSYAARVINAWSSWVYAGTAQGVLTAVTLTGLTNVVVKDVWAWPNNGGTTNWARAWVVIGKPNPWSPTVWSNRNTWSPSRTWGSTAKPEEVNLVLRQVREWKPAHASVRVHVLLSGKMWGGGWTWGDGSVWGGAIAKWRPLGLITNESHLY